MLSEAELFDDVPVVAQSTSLPVHPATSAASGGHTRPHLSLMCVPGGASDTADYQRQQLEGDLLVTQQDTSAGHVAV